MDSFFQYSGPGQVRLFNPISTQCFQFAIIICCHESRFLAFRVNKPQYILLKISLLISKSFSATASEVTSASCGH